jgi:hypothetical protein
MASWLCATLLTLTFVAADGADRYRIEPYWVQRWLVQALLSFAVIGAGALQRLAWRQIGGAMALSVLVGGLLWPLAEGNYLALLWVHGKALSILLVLMAAGLFEWRLTARERRGALPQLLLMLLAAAGPLAILAACIALAQPMHVTTDSWVGVFWHQVDWLLLAAAAWLIVPAGLRATPPMARRGWGRRGAVTAALMLLYPLLFLALLYPLARRSVVHGAPLDAGRSALLLLWRHSPRDTQAVYAALNAADWEDYALPLLEDYRSFCVFYLERHDPTHGAEFLSQGLLRTPRAMLAEVAAPLLGAQRRLETAPLLVRYALAPSGAVWAYQRAFCPSALADMGVPAAAELLIWECMGRGDGVDDETRQRLTRLLGEDAGASLDAWQELHDRVIKERPNPLPPALAAETQRTLEVMLRYGEAVRGWRESAWQLAVARARPTAEAIAGGYHENASDLRERSSIKFRQALRDLGAPAPNLNVCGVDELEKEIAAYEQALRQRLVRYSLVK